MVIQHTCACRNTGLDLIAVTPDGVDTQNGMDATQSGSVTEDVGESQTPTLVPCFFCHVILSPRREESGFEIA